MRREEAALNALIPAVLLRGTVHRPDLRAISLHLDDLYGASVGDLVRRVGDYQAVGFYCSFIDDRFALPGDQVLFPLIDLLKELLLQPLTEGEGFCKAYVEGEKRNFIATIEAQRNDKRYYVSQQMLKKMCAEDSYGIPRLGEKEQMEAIDPVSAYAHYQRILRESPVEIFYVGSAKPEILSEKLKEIFQDINRELITLPPHTPLCNSVGGRYSEDMVITQGKLSMGFVTPITSHQPDFAVMQVFNALFGAGMTSKLFVNIREKQSLCYSIDSGYYSSKGIFTVFAGVDTDKEELVEQEIFKQMESCQRGEITDEELTAAKEFVLSGLRGIYDSPGSIEAYECAAAVIGAALTLEQNREMVQAVTVDQIIEAAKSLRYHTTYYLKGVEA
jgi:predicted Zn-dependent peptidase